jgi:hypothetical protein
MRHPIIQFNLECDSDDIDESDVQNEKHDKERISTLHGILIGSSEEDANADNSIQS